MFRSLDKDIDGIICCVHPGDNPGEDWHNALHQQMLEKTMKWFHQVMQHPGKNCCVKYHAIMLSLFQAQMHHDKFKCAHCQRHKLAGKCCAVLYE